MTKTKITRELLSSLTFRPFSKNDYYGFAGVTSPIPMIAETPEFTVILDGGYAELYDNEECECVDQCNNINELPFKSEKQIRIEAEIAKMEKSIAELKSQLS